MTALQPISDPEGTEMRGPDNSVAGPGETVRSQLLVGSDNSSLLSLDDSTEQRRCLKNMTLLCLATMLVFTSYVSLVNLEGSFNHSQSMGPVSTIVLFSSLIVACFFAPFVVRYTGYKWAMAIFFGVNCAFAIANYFPRVYVLAPVCAVLGLASAPFWVGQGQYVTTLAVKYAAYRESNPDVAISRFNGMFFMFFQSALIWSNMISSLVVTPSDPDHLNLTYLVNETCGANFCGFPNGSEPSANLPTSKEHKILVSTYLACCGVGLFIQLLLVDDIKPLAEAEFTEGTPVDSLLATIRIHCNYCLLLLVPFMFFNGLQHVFLVSQFTEAFVSCELTVGYISYVVLTFGVVNSLSSFAMGQLELCSGRLLLYLVAACLNLGLSIAMLQWTQAQGDRGNWLLYFIPGLWAVGDSVWQTTTVSLLAVEFAHERDAAFSAFRLWQALGMGVAYSYGFYICMRSKIFITLGLLVLSFGLYLVMELFMRRRVKKPYIDLYAPIVE